jgi:hypothetical protein
MLLPEYSKEGNTAPALGPDVGNSRANNGDDRWYNPRH